MSLGSQNKNMNLPKGFTIREIEDRNEETSDFWFGFFIGVFAVFFIYSILN